MDASLRQFCATARARLQVCCDFDANRHFLVDHIEREIYERYDVSVVGAILVAAPAAITHAEPWVGPPGIG